MISVCVQEHTRIEGHVRQICERMQSDRNRPALQFKQSELGELSLASVDGAVRWAYETLDGVATDASVEQYISELEGDGMYLAICHLWTVADYRTITHQLIMNCVDFILLWQTVCTLLELN